MRVLVEQAARCVYALTDLVQLGDEQRSRTGYVDVACARVTGGERGDAHRCVINDHGLQADCATGRALRMGRDACASTTLALGASQSLGDHEIDRYVVRAEPGARLRSVRVEMKPGPAHRVLQSWRVSERAAVESDVAVLGRLGERDVCTVGVEVYGLRPDHDHRLQVGSSAREGVEQRRARRGQQISVARRVHWLSIQPSSACASLGPRPGAVSRSTATWLGAAKRRPSMTSGCVRKGKSSSPAATKTFVPLSTSRSSELLGGPLWPVDVDHGEPGLCVAGRVARPRASR